MSKPKLTVELVPQTCWYSNVRSNVSKEEWDFIRRKAYAQAGHVCEICGGKGSRWPVECHEVWHYNDETHTQTLKRMCALCPACHEVKHIGRAHAYGGLDRALYHLGHINNWSMEEALDYVNDQFYVWEERSQHKWKLDISYLGKFFREEEEGW